MRLLLVTTWFPTSVAPSSGIFVAKDAQLLARRHDVHVVHLASPALLSPEDAGADVIEGYRVTRIPMSTRNPLDILRAGHALRRHLRGADVLHTQAFSTLLPFARVRVRIPWVHTEHWSALSNPETIGRASHALSVAARLLRRPAVVTAVCEYLADPIRSYRPGPTRVVPCIVPPAAQLVAPPGGAGPRLVAVGGLVERKDPLCALDALQTLRASGLDATLTWVGEGPLRDALTLAAEEKRLTDSLTLAGGRDQEGVIAALRDADIFLLPTRGENFCVSAAEAIVQGRPVVVGVNGGQREYVTPENGELVTVQSGAAYAEGVMRVWNRRSERSAAAIAATIGDRFAPDSVLAGYEAAYGEAGATGR